MTEGGQQRIALARGKALRLGLDAASAIGCSDGRLWLTIDGDPKDYVLDAGDTLLLHDLRPLHVVVALRDSVMWVRQVDDPAFTRESWAGRAVRAVRDWWRQAR